LSTSTNASRGVTLNIRVDPKRRDLIDRAAEATGKTRSEFMLETACKEAEAVLLDRRYFALDDGLFGAFMERLDEPATSERLKALLNTKAPWET
jgi:uncharacterized protein (DUF1778 family)